MRLAQLNHALIGAIKRRDTRQVETLLAVGADPDAQDALPQRVSLRRPILAMLHGERHALIARPTALLVALEGDKVGGPVVRALLEHGANPNVTDGDGSAPLRLALDAGRLDVTWQLLDHGASAAVADRTGRTALMQAAGWGDPQEVKCLLESGANVNAVDADGLTALMYAVNEQRDDNVPILLGAHPDLHIRDKHGETALSIAMDCLVAHDVTPFHHEAHPQRGWTQIVRMLRQANATGPE